MMKKAVSYLLLTVLLVFIAYRIYYFAKKSSPTANCPTTKILLINNIPQKSENLCGGACMEMVLKYYTINADQCTLVNSTNCQSCLNSNNPQVILFPSDIQTKLGSSGLTSTIITGGFDSPTVIKEICANRPIIALVYRHFVGGIISGHYVVFSGYTKDNAGNFWVKVLDPWNPCEGCTYFVPLKNALFTYNKWIINIQKK